MDWLSDVITPDVSVRLRCKASQTDTAVVLVVPTTSVRVQTVPSKGHNKACQVATSARQNDMTSSEQLMVMQGIVSNLGALRDEEHEHDELRQEQIEQLEKQFDYKIAQLQQEIGQQARRLKDSEECRVKAEEEATRRENKLRTQLDKRAEEEVKLKEILSNLEHENAKLQRLCTENAPVEALYSPRAITTLERDGSSVNNVDIIQEIIASQPVDVYKKVPVPREPSPEPVYTPFKDKPYITCQYNHPTETLADVRRRAEDELLSKIKEITGSRSTAKLSDEDYALHQAQRRQQDRGDHETRRNRLKDELSELAQSPSAYPSAALPPKSPSVRRESTHSAKDYYKAGGYNDFDEEETQSYGVEYQGDEEPEIHTAVKMRPKKLKSKDIEEEESIFSFDGWSKNKAGDVS